MSWPWFFMGVLLLAAACGGAPSDGPAAPPPVIATGEALYAENCSRCHGFDEGGDIRDIPPPHNQNGHTWHHPDQQLSEIVLTGLDFAIEGQQTMPAFKDKLSADQVQAILDYIKTWWTEDQRSFQSTVTAGSEQ